MSSTPATSRASGPDSSDKSPRTTAARPDRAVDVRASTPAETEPETMPPDESARLAHLAREQGPGVTRSGQRTAVADAALEPGAAPSRGERVGAALRAWRGELAQTGGPNALLWYSDAAGGALDLTQAHPTGVSMLMAGNTVRLSHLVREASAFRGALATAHRIRAKAAELREDHGLEALFVCIGMASWATPGTYRPPAAPLMLRPARLHAADAAETDLELELLTRVEINPVFLHYMRSEQGVPLDGDALADLAYASGRFDPLPVYRELHRLLVHVPDFTILDRRVISTFAPSKMAMVADLAAFAGMLAGNDMIAALAGDATAAQALRADGEGGLADSSRRTGDADLTREVLVLDADVGQADVIDAARSGRHVLLDAGRGTGATQTLANVAAALVGSDQRVLVISENARQLDAFVTHLGAAGLSDLVLDARDPLALRRTLGAAALARLDPPEAGERARGSYDRETPDPFPSLRAPGDPGDPANPGDTPEKALARTRGRLIAHVDCLHAPRQPWGVSVFEAQAALVQLSTREDAPTSRIRIPAGALRALTPTERDRVAREITDLAREGAWTPTPTDDDPWWGARLEGDEGVLQALRIATDLVGGRLDSDRTALDACLADAGLPPARTARDWDRALALVADVRETLAVLQPGVFIRPLEPLMQALDPAGVPRSSWWARQAARKEARALALPHARIDSLHAALREAHDRRRAWADMSGRDEEPRIPEQYDDALIRWAALEADLGRLDEALSGTRAGDGLLDDGLDALQARLAALSARTDRVAVLPAVSSRLDALTAAGLGEVLDDLAARHVPAEKVAGEFEFQWWRSLLDLIAEEDPTYGGHDGAALRTLVADYADDDRELLGARARQILDRARAHARVEASSRPGQVSLLREAATAERHHRPIRALLADTGDVVAAVTPIWVMSPLLLASVVPTHLAFDAVLIDDAGRMPLAHAVSALARGVRVVAAGDLQGIGPQHFETVAGGHDASDTHDTDAADDTDDADQARDVGKNASVSVLEALARHLPVRHLHHVHGDRDARIAAFATALRTEPVNAWPNAGRGTALRPLRTGAVLSSADEVGEALARENARVVEAVLEHARRRPNASLAVLTLTSAQAADIERAIRKAFAAAAESAAAPFLAEAAPERFLITTVDRAAGHSRDSVIFATGVEPLPDLSVRLPERLRRPDGPRLIAEVAGVARRRLDVVSALTASDLACIDSSCAGLDRLAELLSLIERDGRGQAYDASGGEQHALLAELAGRLRTEGLTVHEGWGIGGARIDLVVEDPYVPGKFTVAVVSDGRRNAALGSARERERLLPEELARRGWRCVRVWSTDIFRDPARDVARIIDAVREGDAMDETR